MSAETPSTPPEPVDPIVPDRVDADAVWLVAMAYRHAQRNYSGKNFVLLVPEGVTGWTEESKAKEVTWKAVRILGEKTCENDEMRGMEPGWLAVKLDGDIHMAVGAPWGYRTTTEKVRRWTQLTHRGERSFYITREESKPEIEAGRDVAIYKDGSGSARYQMLSAMARISEWQQNNIRLRDFIRTHEATLAGMSWSVGSHWEAEIEISWSYYRGSETRPADIAKLWPGAAWFRRRRDYPSEGCEEYDWRALVDFVWLTLDRAERIRLKPRNLPEDGGPVNFGAAVESEVVS